MVNEVYASASHGICGKCGDVITQEQPAFRVKSSRHTFRSKSTYHFKCMDREVREEVASTNTDVRLEELMRWFDEFEVQFRVLKTEMDETIDGPRNLWGNIKGIWDDLFPNGIISDKTLVAKDICLKDRLDIEEGQSWMGPRNLFISSRGIAVAKPGQKVARYKRDLLMPLLIMAYKEEIASFLASYKDRETKFRLFAEALEEHWNPKMFNPATLNTTVEEVDLEKYLLDVPENFKYDGDRGVKLSSKRTTSLRLKFSYDGSFHIYPVRDGDELPGYLTLNSRVKKLDMYQAIWPAFESLLKAKAEWIDEWNEVYQETIHKIQEKVDDYLLIYSI